MNPLEKRIRHAIELNGPMSIETFMSMAVNHYYATRDPFGAKGDFVTAPEVSQMFGELIGIWVADTWIKMGRPSSFQLVEGGPGRGTLMADILRATKRIEGFHNAANIHLIETSPVLRETQEHALSDYHVSWHDSLETLSSDPLIFVANELFDAFPIRQFECRDERWHERVVGIENDQLTFGLRPVDIKLPVVNGAVKEVSPQSLTFINKLANMIMAQKGAALIIDYGYDEVHVGDTLQAVKNHQFSPVLEDPGEADLTAHVDFQALKIYAPEVAISGTVTQGVFLKNMGINIRMERLKTIATPQQVLDLQSGYVRLTADDQMGKLFKVLGLCHDPAIQLGGFTSD